jgi:hypothetical protein
MALAFSLWAVLAGQDMNAVDMTVPLELAGLPDDLVVRGEAPASVTFQVLANAAQIRFLSDRKPHLRLNVALAREGENVFPVPADALALPRGVKVTRSNPSVIEFTAVRVAQKTVPIRLVVQGSPDPPLELASVLIEPTMAMVKGPRELLDRINDIATTPIEVAGLTGDANLTALPALIDLDPAVSVEPDLIRVYVNLEERSMRKTFAKIPISVEVSDAEDSGEPPLAAQPAAADVTVAWPVSMGPAPKAGAVRARVRVDRHRLAEKGGLMELPVLVDLPAGGRVIAIDPVTVKVRARPRAGNQDGQAPPGPGK